jgi:hypothetical protein
MRKYEESFFVFSLVWMREEDEDEDGEVVGTSFPVPGSFHMFTYIHACRKEGGGGSDIYSSSSVRLKAVVVVKFCLVRGEEFWFWWERGVRCLWNFLLSAIK